MKNTRKGFTLVELVIVIAVIAILAGVLIATFASVIKRANQSAEVQNIKNAEIAQKADDIIKKIEEANWFGWEDFEADIVAKITSVVKENPSSFDATALNKVVEDAIITALANKEAENTDLTAEQVEAIVANALGTLKFEGVTEAQVRAIVNSSAADVKGSQLTAAQVKMIVNAANENNLTAAQVAEIVGRATFSTPSDIESAVTTITTALTSSTAGLATSAQVEELKELIEETAQAVQSQDIDDVITAKSLNIRIKNAGLTSANYPYQVFEHIGFDVVPDKSTILLSIENGQLGFFVVNSDRKVVNPCGLTIDVNADDTVVYKYWTFVDNYDTSLTCSQYLLGTNVTGTIDNVDTGLDVGKNEGISAINYISNTGNTVVIKTNSTSTTLTIDDASTGSIYHYGSAGALNIIQCHTASYHENGKVAYVEIAKGRIVLEEGADIEEIHINKKTDSSFDTVIIANNGSSEELPERITRDAVNVENKTVVVTVESNGSSEQVYVYANGTTGKTNKVTEGDNKQNENVNSALGQLVLDNGSNPGEKAQTAEEKAEAKDEVASEAVSANFEKNPENANYVARIGQTGYLKIKDAIDAATDGKTVVLLKDVEFEGVSGNNRLFITHNIILDGNNHTVTAHGRGFGIGTSKVTFKNITINNPDNGARCIDTRGGANGYPHVEELNLINVVLSTPGSGSNLQPLTIGGNQTTKVRINIDNCELKTSDNGNTGYTIITFNPVDLTIRNSKISGWSALYMKGIDSSAGSNGSTVKVYDSELYSFNKYSGPSDNFGTIVLEDANIDILLQDCKLTANTEYVSQSLIVFSAADKTICNNSNVLIQGNGTSTYGTLVTNGAYAYDTSRVGGAGCSLEIKGGTFTADPTDFVDATNYKIIGEGPYTVLDK